MKLHRSLLLIIFSLLASCKSIATASPVRVESTPTVIPVSTSTSLPAATSTAVPIFAELSCEPSTNPYAENPLINPVEAAYLPNIPISRICAFEGKISRGQIYKHQITEILIFCLVPGGIMPNIPDKGTEGWNIVISDSLPGSCDYSSANFVNFGLVVTPPFHGNVSFDVFGWQFRNENNTEDLDNRFNRYFNFVFDREDYDTYWYGTRCGLWNGDTDCALATQTSTNTDISRSSGKFSVTNLKLGNLVPNSRAWIEYMEFRFEVYLADE